MRFAARFVISLVLLFVLWANPSFAQSPVQPQTQPDLHNYTQNVMIEVTSALTCMLAGVDPIRPNEKCLGIANGKIGPVDSQGGTIGMMGNLIALTFAPSVHTIDFVNYMAGNFGIAKNTYAKEVTSGNGGGGAGQASAGIGFRGLTPLTQIWVVFRNLVYLLFVLLFILIGFAIMLRVHIDPRTVMTVENQVPKIVVALILVTFSFAIVGLLIDLMWVFTYLVIGVFASINPQISESFNNIQGENALQIANKLPGGLEQIVTNSSAGVGGLISGLFDGTGGRVVAGLLMGLLAGSAALIPGAFIVGITGGVIAGVTGLVFGSQILGFIGSIFAFLIIGIALLYALFRLWFQLIRAYVMILIVAVFSPFWILGGLLPGSRLSFTSLMRELGANLVTFPATIVMFLLGKTFIDIFGNTPSSEVFVPPLIGSPATPKAIGAIVGLGIILLTPDVNKLMRKALQAPEFDFSAIAGAVGVGASVPGRLIGGGMSLAYGTHYDESKGVMVGKGGTVGKFLRSFGFVR